MRDWLNVAFRPGVVRRGLKYAVVVGAVLAAINHGDAILSGELTARHWAKIGITLLVPYCVSVLSSVGAILDVRARTSAVAPDEEGSS